MEHKKIDPAIEQYLQSPTKIWAADVYGKAKSYYVMSSTEFWTHYTKMQRRRHHEVIYSESPCSVYMDLDQENPASLEYCNMYAFCIVERVKKKLRSLFPSRAITVAMCDSTLMPEKYSKHIVFNVDGIAFANQAVVKAFVQRAIAVLPLEAKEMVDLNVYNSNHCMRLLLSEKQTHDGRVRTFNLSKDYNATLSPDVVEYKDFYDSLCQKDNLPALRARAVEVYSPHAITVRSRFLEATRTAEEFPDYVVALAEYIGSVWESPKKCRVKPYKFDKMTMTAHFSSSSRKCAIKEKRLGISEHKSNTVMFECDMPNLRFRQFCRDSDCARQNSGWTNIEEDCRCARLIRDELRILEAALEFFRL